MKMKDNFLNNLLILTQEEDLTFQEALEIAWTHGASTAFYLPVSTFEEVGEGGRRAYAKYVLEGLYRIYSPDDELEDDIIEALLGTCAKYNGG